MHRNRPLGRAVFLDRDGVLNRAFVRDGRPCPPKDLDEVEILPGVREACHELRAAGYVLVVVTNQPDVARGRQTLATVNRINDYLQLVLPLDEVVVCPHDDADGCSCRKPKPGMLLGAAKRLRIDPTASFAVGDRWRDIDAGRRAGCRTILIDRGYSEPLPERPDAVVFGLPEAVRLILERSEPGVSTTLIDSLKVKIFADGADRAGIIELAANPVIRGFTTNPTLMRKAGLADYEGFGREILEVVPDRPISFEVLSDDFDEMERQARTIASWGDNVYVKIPVTNTRGVPSGDLVRRLVAHGIKLNVTALLTLAQVRDVAACLDGSASSYVSVFAGRIADTGRDPVPLMAAAVELLRPYPGLELVWASPREILNIIQADTIGCHIITVTHDVLGKLPTFGRDLEEFSLDTVRMFHDDAHAAGYVIDTADVPEGGIPASGVKSSRRSSTRSRS